MSSLLLTMGSLRLLGFLGALVCLTVACKATMYMVGDSAGWDVSTNLDSWAADKRFVVGDVLAFQYSSSSGGVCELTKKDFESCNTTNAILRSTTGNTTIPLTKPGDTYVACCNQLYCLSGMKLQVHVEPNSTAAAAAPVGAPQAALGPTGSLPRTSKSNHPILSSSAEFIKIGDSFFLFLFSFVGYLILGSGTL